MANVLPIIILCVLTISVIVAVVRMFQKGFKIGTFISLIFATLLLLFGGFLYLDVTNFSNNFYTSSNMFILTEDNEVLTGFDGMMEMETDKPHFFTKEDIETMTALYQEEDYDGMIGDNYKMFIIDMEAFKTLEKNISIDEYNFTLEFVHGLIKSNTTTEDYIDELLNRKNVSEKYQDLLKEDLLKQTEKDIGDDYAFKGALFASGMLGSALEEQKTLFLFKNLQYGRMKIHEETLLFKSIKYMPVPYLEAIID